jgi:hypothetical protein
MGIEKQRRRRHSSRQVRLRAHDIHIKSKGIVAAASESARMIEVHTRAKL